MTPAQARAILLHLLLAWVAVLSATLAWHGAAGAARRRLAAGMGRPGHLSGRAAVVHGVARAALGAAGLAFCLWLVR